MIVKLKNPHSSEMVKNEILNMTSNVTIDVLENDEGLELGITGKLGELNKARLNKNEHVKSLVEIQEPYKKVSRQFKNKDTVIDINGIKIGGDRISVIAGPCAVESKEQLLTIANDISKSGSNFLRGGAFKPRTSPYSFQGLGEKGLELLSEAKEKTGMPIITELMSSDLLPMFLKHNVDAIQIGARNMQNFDLLKAVGKTDLPILLKRGMSSTIKEFLNAAEYIMAQGNDKVILVERGIRTFEDFTRNTLDLSSVIAIKRLSHLPVIVDPSHGTGKWWMVEKMAKAALMVGADGIMVEVHHNPKEALSDGPQSLKPERFSQLMQDLQMVGTIVGKSMQG